MNAVLTEDWILFPLVKHLPSGRPPSAALKVYNSLISGNEPQLQAVASVVAQRPGSLPFVILDRTEREKLSPSFNECIRQLKILSSRFSHAHLATPIRLQGHLGKNELFRFYAPSYRVLDELRPYTFTQADGHFGVPTMDRLKNFKVNVINSFLKSLFHAVSGKEDREASSPSFFNIDEVIQVKSCAKAEEG